MESDTTRSAYDRVVDAYAERMLSELQHKPLDREMLDRFAKRVAGKGRAVDLGCGPGQIARYLYERGADVYGIDLSPAMVERARREHPGIDFQLGDMRALTLPDSTLAGIAAFYSIIHIPRENVVTVLQELRRVLQPEGLLLLAFHLGDDVRHFDEWYEQPVSVDFYFFQREEMADYLRAAGFEVEETIEREPYPQVEVETHRAYIFARNPAT